MKARELVGDIDDSGVAWTQGIAREWAKELDDPREDLYTLTDGSPVSGPVRDRWP